MAEDSDAEAAAGAPAPAAGPRLVRTGKAPLLFFINPGSGSGLAPAFLATLEGKSAVSIVRLPAEAGAWASAHAALLADPRLRLVACGGDGTANWVVSLCNAQFGAGDAAGRPPIAIVPFGTGNDLSRALGWGRGMAAADLARTPRRLRAIRTSAVKALDVWNVDVRAGADAATYQMLNYCSLGVDAETAVDFERCRKGRCRPCFCCHCMSLCCYFPVGLANACCKRPLGAYATVRLSDAADGGGAERELATGARDKTVIFQAIPSMYAGLDPWAGTAPAAMDDRKFEVTLQGGSVSLGLFQMGIQTGRPQCQATKAVVTTTEPAYLQVDGEGKFLNGPAEITVQRIGSYPFVLSATDFN
jgi:diacylglycerol kinase (ATP)